MQATNPYVVAECLCPAILAAVDGGATAHVATVLRMLFDRGLQPLLMWLVVVYVVLHHIVLRFTWFSVCAAYLL